MEHQVGPMFNNVRSMLRVVSAFRDETDNNIKTSVVKKVGTGTISNKLENTAINNNSISYGPTFFTE